MNFSEALKNLKLGTKIYRECWVDTYLTLVQGYPVNGHLNAIADTEGLPDLTVPELTPDGTKNITQGKAGQMRSHIVMKIAGGSESWGINYSDYIPWIPSQIDILAEDWMFF